MEQQTILIVDDSQDTRLILVKVLKSMNYRIVEAASARAALESIRGDPHLAAVVLDLGLPDMDGLEVLQLINKERPRLPVCVLSSRRDRDSVAQAVHLGCADYLVKPWFIDSFSSRIARLTGRQAETQPYHPIRASLKVKLVGATIEPDLSVVQITEDGLLLRSSAAMTPGTMIELAAPALERTVAMPRSFHCRVGSCRRSGYGKYVVQVQFVGIAEDIVSKIRARSVRSLALLEP